MFFRKVVEWMNVYSGLAYDANPEDSYYGALGFLPQRPSMSEPRTIDKR